MNTLNAKNSCRTGHHPSAAAPSRRVLCLAILVQVVLVTVAPGRAERLPVDVESQFARALADFDLAQQIQSEQPDRARQLFRLAAQAFESIVAAEVTNGRLEFNLANCFLQAGDVGQAILHYRRAQRLLPRAARLADNLAEARSRRLTSIKPTRQSALLRSLFFWHHDTSVAGRSKGAVVLYIAFWAMLTLRNFVAGRGLTGSMIVCAMLTLVLSGSVAYSHWSDRRAPAGVVTRMDVVVHKGPGTGYQRQFEQPLQPGVEFVQRERRSGWWNIELPDGKTGWVEAAGAELIPTAIRSSLTEVP